VDACWGEKKESLLLSGKVGGKGLRSYLFSREEEKPQLEGGACWRGNSRVPPSKWEELLRREVSGKEKTGILHLPWRALGCGKEGYQLGADTSEWAGKRGLLSVRGEVALTFK